MARTVLDETQSLGHLPRRRTFARLPYGFLEPLAEGRLARQLLHLLGLPPAVRAPYPIQFQHHRRLVLKAGQVPHFSLIHLTDLAHPTPAARTHDPPVARLAPHPQLQRLGGLVDLRSVDSVTRPPQNLRPVVVSQTAESIEKRASLKTPSNRTLCQISCAEPKLREDYGMIRARFLRSTSPTSKPNF